MTVYLRRRFVVIVLSVMVILSSCIKLDTPDMYVSLSSVAKSLLEDSVRNGWSIRDVHIENGLIVVSFSNAEVFCLPEEFSCLLQIGVDGYWYLNGLRSDWTWEVIDGKEIATSIISGGCVQQTSDSSTNPGLYCILESYTDWTFSFTDGSAFSIIKSSHCFNYDSIIRGVNHRGYCTRAPENTLPAYRLSRLEGFTYVETDVRFTADGVPVCLHDASVDRTSNGSGSVKDMTLAQLQELDFGQWKGGEYAGTTIPTLEEFLELCQSIGLVPYIELKAGSAAQVSSVVSLVEQYNLKGKAVYISFSLEFLKYVLLSDQSARVGYLTSLLNEDVIKKAEELRCLSFDSSLVFIDSSDYSTEAVSLCESNSIPLEVWTIDSESSILSLSPYISGVTSNRVHAGRILWDQRR